MNKTKLCKFCGEEFVPDSNRQIYCKRPHYHNCPVCGKQYEVTNVENLKRPPVACSYACRAKRTRETSLKKYGCLAPGNNPAAREKAKQTCLKNNGTEYALQSKAVREKAQATILTRYGVDNVSKNDKIKEKRKATCKERYGDVLPFNLPECYAKQHDTIQKRYGVPYASLIPRVQQTSKQISKLNKQFSNRLKEVGIDNILEFPLGKKSYDILIPDQNILIEINPTYTHNAVGNHWSDTGLDKYYHRDKSENAIHNGYRCIHIWDWDDKEKIISMLRPKLSLDASDMRLYRLTPQATNEFLDKNDLAGRCRDQLLCLGLVKDDEIYQVMTFGRPKYDKDHSIQLMRICTKLGYSIMDGYDTITKRASEEFGVYGIISYCDRSKFTGEVYEKIGMKLLRKTPPQEVWSKGDRKITANLLRQRGYDQLFRTNYGKGISNEQLMLEDGWLPVYDCGQLVYEFK